jgi:flavorubredoxin
MKVSIIDLQKNKSSFYRNGIKTLADLIKGRGFDVVCSLEPDIRDILSSCFIIVCASRTSTLGTKLDPSCQVLLSRIKGLTGKKSFALLFGSGFFMDKAILNLMSLMESEGMKVLNSASVSKLSDIERTGTLMKIPVS